MSRFSYKEKNFNFTLCALLIQSFFALWAVSRVCHFSSRSILAPILFAALFLYFKYISELKVKKQEIFTRHTAAVALAVSLFFTLLFLLAESSSLTEGLDSRLFRLMILTVCGIGFFFLIYGFLSLLLILAVPYTLTENSRQVKHIPLFCFFACLLGWFPYFLYEYPAIMTPDSINQLEQVLAMIPYSNHHPWVHTMIIKVFYSIGFFLTGNQNAALAFFTVFQMCFMAVCAAWLVVTLQKLGVKNAICYFIAAFYALVPYHAVFVVTVWKDVMFSGVVLLFTTALTRLFFFVFTADAYSDDNPSLAGNGFQEHSNDLMDDSKHKQMRSGGFADNFKHELILSCTVYALSGIMMCLLRSNGWYAFLFSLPFLLYAFRRCLKIMLPLHLAILAAALLVKIPVMNAFHVTQPDFIESICIPLQQTARVLYEEKELTPEQWESVHKVMDTTYIKELYAPGFADNMKELVRAGHPAYLTEHKGEYFRLWLSLGLRYPGAYLRAYIDQTIGYWYPDVSYTVGDIDGIIANETGIASQPLIGGPFVVKAKEILLKLGDMLPLYGLLFSMGAMFWALIGCIAIIFAQKQYRRSILFLPGLAVILTLLVATPVSSEFRYAYSLAYALPLYLLLPFIGR